MALVCGLRQSARQYLLPTWFRPYTDMSVSEQREIHSYLKSDSPLILIWNIESNQAGYHADLRQLIQARDALQATNTESTNG